MGTHTLHGPVPLSRHALMSLFLQDRERIMQHTEDGVEEVVKQNILIYWQIRAAFKGAQDNILGGWNCSRP